MINKLISRKGVVTIIIPLFAIFIQAFIRFILDKDFNTIGITLGALGLGQMLPFFYFDHFVANKVLSVAPTYNTSGRKLVISYDLKFTIEQGEIERMKNLFIIGIFLSLGLFFVTVYLGLTDHIGWHLLFGSMNCVISWYLLLFR